MAWRSGPFTDYRPSGSTFPLYVTRVKLPDEVIDDQAILLSDIFPTGYFGAELAEVTLR